MFGLRFIWRFSSARRLISKTASLKIFFDNWKGKHPMLLQLNRMKNVEDLVEKYKAEGIVKKFKNNFLMN